MKKKFLLARSNAEETDNNSVAESPPPPSSRHRQEKRISKAIHTIGSHSTSRCQNGKDSSASTSNAVSAFSDITIADTKFALRPPSKVHAVGEDEAAIVWWSYGDERDEVGGWEIQRFRLDAGYWRQKGSTTIKNHNSIECMNNYRLEGLQNGHHYRFIVSAIGKAAGIHGQPSEPSNIIFAEKDLPVGWLRRYRQDKSKLYYYNVNMDVEISERPERDPHFLQEAILTSLTPEEVESHTKAFHDISSSRGGCVRRLDLKRILIKAGEPLTTTALAALIREFSTEPTDRLIYDFQTYMQIIAAVKAKKVECQRAEKKNLSSRLNATLTRGFARARGKIVSNLVIDVAPVVSKPIVETTPTVHKDWTRTFCKNADRMLYQATYAPPRKWSWDVPNDVRFFVSEENLSVLQDSFTLPELEDLKRRFTLLDLRGSGAIGVTDARVIFNRAGINFSEKRVRELMKSVDLDNSETIEYQELALLIIRLKGPRRKSIGGKVLTPGASWRSTQVLASASASAASSCSPLSSSRFSRSSSTVRKESKVTPAAGSRIDIIPSQTDDLKSGETANIRLDPLRRTKSKLLNSIRQTSSSLSVLLFKEPKEINGVEEEWMQFVRYCYDSDIEDLFKMRLEFVTAYRYRDIEYERFDVPFLVTQSPYYHEFGPKVKSVNALVGTAKRTSAVGEVLPDLSTTTTTSSYCALLSCLSSSSRTAAAAASKEKRKEDGIHNGVSWTGGTRGANMTAGESEKNKVSSNIMLGERQRHPLLEVVDKITMGSGKQPHGPCCLCFCRGQNAILLNQGGFKFDDEAEDHDEDEDGAMEALRAARNEQLRLEEMKRKKEAFLALKAGAGGLTYLLYCVIELLYY